ncbi:MAG: long-chain fatty acid--CoA ligase [Chloroflexi bacterium]|nr:long-chain fatty acid--CoA ligase [Chloroflexota bacterium]
MTTSSRPMFDTAAKYLRHNYLQYGDKKVAMRVKDMGIWQSYTWKDYYEKAKYFSLGLISLGLEHGDKVAILGENKPEWYWAELAAGAAGAVVTGIFVDCLPTEVKYYVENSESKFVVAHDQEQVDKFLNPYKDREGNEHPPLKEELPLLKKVIFWDSKGILGYEGIPIGDYDDPILMSFEQVLELGKEYEKDHPGSFEENIEKTSGEDIGLFMYTSGTTGLPKAAMMQNRTSQLTNKAWDYIDKWSANEQYVSFLPPAWVTEQGLGIGANLLTGMEVNFPEEPETVLENIREIGPGILFWGPANWENVSRMIQAKIIDTSPLRRLLYHICLPIGYKVGDLRLAAKRVGWFWQFLYWLANMVVFRALKDKVGLSKVRIAYSAGSAISPDIFRYFQALGVKLKQLYGSTEMGLVTIHPDDDVRPETCGPLMPGYECRLDSDGEIMVRSEMLFAGYYKKPEATKEKYRGDWYTSGDFGHIDEHGHLICIDRMDHLKELRGGRKFSPQFAEIRLRFSPYIKGALVVGSEDRDFVTTIINTDIENVGRWAEARRIPYTTFSDLSQKPEVIKLVEGEIRRVNRSLPEWNRIKKFVNLHKEFDADDAELTRTRKLRRDFIEERYGYLIEALYGDKAELQVEAPITYRDGRTGTIITSVKVNTVE